MRRKGQLAVLRQTTRLGAWILILRLAKKISVSMFRFFSSVLPHGYFSRWAVLKNNRWLLVQVIRHLPNTDHAVDDLAMWAVESDNEVILGMILRYWELDDPDEIAQMALKHGLLARFWQVYRAHARDMHGMKTYLRMAADDNQPAIFRELLGHTNPATFSDAYWALLTRLWQRQLNPAMVDYLASLRAWYMANNRYRRRPCPTAFAGNGWYIQPTFWT